MCLVRNAGYIDNYGNVIVCFTWFIANSSLCNTWLGFFQKEEMKSSPKPTTPFLQTLLSMTTSSYVEEDQSSFSRYSQYKLAKNIEFWIQNYVEGRIGPSRKPLRKPVVITSTSASFHSSFLWLLSGLPFPTFYPIPIYLIATFFSPFWDLLSSIVI